MAGIIYKFFMSLKNRIRLEKRESENPLNIKSLDIYVTIYYNINR